MTNGDTTNGFILMGINMVIIGSVFIISWYGERGNHGA